MGIKVVVVSNFLSNYTSCLDCLSRSLSYRFADCFQLCTNITCSTLEVKLKWKWFWDLLLLGMFEFLDKIILFLLLWSIYLLPGTVHSSIQQFALHLAPFFGAKVRSGWLEGWFWKLNYQDLFESFCSKPIITLHTTQE